MEIITMSLNNTEKKVSSMELQENYKILSFDPDQICTDLGLSSHELKNTLHIGLTTNPTTVWKLRDYMEEKILQQGKTPYPYSILKNNIYFLYTKNWD